ncbi:hypothetical protein [Kingella kingae]|uniref:hypothetical protein n=1 Tax=Kingella kingae TaxID=504 RepID=UPI000409D152|nr:hypothetical protein [Kingella kingae]MDK4530091.1 hypothetical protein [Kingella kingae]MDK4580795.1 hypothetical protein [Kingella kingae]
MIKSSLHHAIADVLLAIGISLPIIGATIWLHSLYIGWWYLIIVLFVADCAVHIGSTQAIFYHRHGVEPESSAVARVVANDCLARTCGVAAHNRYAGLVNRLANRIAATKAISLTSFRFLEWIRYAVAGRFPIAFTNRIGRLTV